MYPAFSATSQVNPCWNIARGLGGAAVGGTAGYFLTVWLARQGFYAMILPGALLGMGCGALIVRRSFPLAAFCGLAALALGLVAEWKLHPFIADRTWNYFVQNLGKLQPVTYLMLSLGALGGYWFSLGNRHKALRATTEQPPGPPPK
jgi:hypothetical protein